ncbi:hypothetical protein [Thalassolituus maritimus]|uniref:Type IV pilus/biofilm regulator FimL n=1 Tax=Thalassolituus maritimus TaxID=484498 RepID=A0ABQ0A1D9_9GAMM
MADLSSAEMSNQFASSLHVVRREIENALDHASVQLDTYSSDGSEETIRAFLEEIRQLRGTFKMLDFRAGERLCEEITETTRRTLSDGISDKMLEASTQAVVYLKRYIEFIIAGQEVAPSLLIPTINIVRRERGEKALPEGYFFLNNLRPKLPHPARSENRTVAYRRVRQMLQLGLLGLIRSNGKRGPLQVLTRAVDRIEQAARSSHSWVFWEVVSGALEALQQDEFEVTPQRIALIGQLDRLVRQLQASDGGAFNEAPTDALLKEFLYLIALAQPDSERLSLLQDSFQLKSHVRERELRVSRNDLSGPDQSALVSFARALQDEIEALKDIIDRSQRNPDLAAEDSELIERLERISDTLIMVDMNPTAELADGVIRQLRNGNLDIERLADDIIRIEQDVHAIIQSNHLKGEQIIDPVTLKEANIAVVSEAVTALVMVKRAVAAYVDSGDKLHVKNVGKSLRDVSGAVVFLEKKLLRDMLLELEEFVEHQVMDARVAPSAQDMDAFADAVTAVEYYLDTYDSPSSGGEDALRMAEESMVHLRSGHVAN